MGQFIEKKMSSALLSRSWLYCALTAVSLSPWSVYAARNPIPDRTTLEISRRLRPISDQSWRMLTQNRTLQTYTVKKGDTLSGISERLFGDRKYWPKIWAINHAVITNPHILDVGTQLTFLGASGSQLPELTAAAPQKFHAQLASTPAQGTLVAERTSRARQDTHRDATDHQPQEPIEEERPLATPTQPNDPNAPMSSEWKDLPPQRWENIQIALRPEIDPLGFDRRSVAMSSAPKGFDLQAVASSTKLDTVAKIQGARSEGNYLGMGDLVYLLADQDMRIGDTFMATGEPIRLTAPGSDRVGYSYHNLGTVRIIGIRGNLYLGKIISTRSFISRGTLLVKPPKRIKGITLTAGKQELRASVLIDKNFTIYTTAQHKQVFLNVGTKDQVQPGMIFRVFQHYDPANDRKVTDTNFIIEADILVLQTSEDISAGLIISSYTPISEYSPAYLLSDLSDVRKNLGFSAKATVANQGNELDSLDSGDAPLTEAEKKELIQLERWKKNPDTKKLDPEFEEDASTEAPQMKDPGSKESVDRGGPAVIEPDLKSEETSQSTPPPLAEPGTSPSSSAESSPAPSSSPPSEPSTSPDSSEKNLEELAPPE
jgi:hypothetical protein